jgi:hypothetical protein
MNYFAHGIHFVEDPYFLAGTAIPDWLAVVDRRVRVSSKSAAEFVGAEDPTLAAVAGGIVQHHRDDGWFHTTPAFGQLSFRFSQEVRELFPGDDGFRASLVGHILVEMLLDAVLISQHPERLDAYYDAMETLDPATVSRAVNRMAKRPTDRLEAFIPLFSAERFLYDYAEDGKLLRRLNRVLRRVGVMPLPEQFCGFLPTARQRVRRHQAELLDGNPSGG